MCQLDEGADLLVNRAGDLLGVIAHVSHVAPQEHLLVLLPVANGAQALGHAVLGDHGPGYRRCPLDVI